MPYTFPVGDEPEGNWIFADTCLAAIQTADCKPSILIDNIGADKYSVWSHFIGTGSSEDDFIGLIFGYEDSSHFYLLDWKRDESYHPEYGLAEEGISIKKISAPSVDSLTASDFWKSSGTEYSTILASSFGEGQGYSSYNQNEFVLEFSHGNFSVIVYDSTSVVWMVTVADGSYTSNRFGFYDFSSQDIEFRVWLQDDPPCGDADRSWQVDIDDVSYVVEYVFAGGTRPYPWYSADVDCSGDVDIDDVVWLINYIFSGGNAPCDTDGDGVPDC